MTTAKACWRVLMQEDLSMLALKISPFSRVYLLVPRVKLTNQNMYFSTPGNGGPGAIPSTTRLYYIELPVNFLYRATLAKGADIHFGGGPYFAQGFAEHNVVGASSDYSQIFSYDNPDFGFDAILGVTAKRFLIDAGFSYGIVNIDETAPQSSHNMVFSISAGYIFK